MSERSGEKSPKIPSPLFTRFQIMSGVLSGAIIWSLLCHDNVVDDRQQVENAAIAAQEHYDRAKRIGKKCGMAVVAGRPKIEATRRGQLASELEELDYQVAQILKNDRQQSAFDDLVSLGSPAGLEQLSEEFKDTVVAAGDHERPGIWTDRPGCSEFQPS
ncbi:MAG TPA: hypothetical protein VFX79_02130 [Candidatus Saccharimonadales bacterium]|nr:hypothetical protein [Candidatus Saccharimonadales bacterium]